MIVAAFDIGSGATKVLVAPVDAVDTPLFAREEELMVKQDVDLHGGAISAAMEERLCLVVRTLRDKAVALGAVRCFGVATAAFRQARNGPDVLARVAAKVGVRLDIVTQQEEGELGFATACGLRARDVPPERVVAVDSGGASFQLTFRGADGHLQCVEGPWGSVSATNALVTQVQGRPLGCSPNPATLEQCARLEALLVARLCSDATALREKLQQPAVVVVGIGGPTSMFRMLDIFLHGADRQPPNGPVALTSAGARHALAALAGHSDAQLAALGYPQPEVLLAKLVLLATIADVLLGPGAVIWYSFCFGSCAGVMFREGAQRKGPANL